MSGVGAETDFGQKAFLKMKAFIKISHVFHSSLGKKSDLKKKTMSRKLVLLDLT